MRTIKFRGFGIWNDCKQWYYGDLIHKTDGTIEIVVESQKIRTYNYEVDPKSVGEWTGLKDKNGKEIYEGDIVSSEKMYGEVVWGYDASWGVHGKVIKNDWENCQVIGNIYENKDLI